MIVNLPHDLTERADFAGPLIDFLVSLNCVAQASPYSHWGYDSRDLGAYLNLVLRFFFRIHFRLWEADNWYGAEGNIDAWLEAVADELHRQQVLD